MLPENAQRRRGRPPKELAGFSQTREDLILAGVAMLTEKGYLATGIDEVLRSVNVPKGSFYHYFASKEQFGHELIDRYGAYFARRLDRFLLNESRAPLDRIHDFIADAKAGIARYDYRRGCLVGNLGQEMSALPDSFRDRLVSVFNDWQTRTARCLESAKQTGGIPESANCASLAAFFWIGWEGAVLRAKLERGAEPLDLFASGFFATLGN